ncbi:MAG: hypothetical protein MUP80_01465 [Acidobacteriia bacterium]|nr:hypothetical protein [Terriglobia bacterium]
MHLEVSSPECFLLLEILQAYRTDLTAEILRTDSVTYRKELKEEAIVDRILGRLHDLKPSEAAA